MGERSGHSTRPFFRLDGPMKQFLIVVVICGLLLWAGVSLDAQTGQVRDTEVIPHETYVIFKQRDRTIYVKRQAVSGFTVYPEGFSHHGHPVIVVFMGAKEFRFDVPSKDKIQPIVDAFIGDEK